MKNNQRLLKRWAALGLALVTSAIASDQGSSTQGAAPNLEITLEVANRELIQAEPLFLKILLENRSTQSVQLPSAWKAMLRVQIRRSGKRTWDDMRYWWEPAALFPPKGPVAMQPGESQAVRLALYSFAPDYEPLFELDKTNAIRVVLHSAKPPVDIISAEVQLKMNAVPEKESEAFQALQRKKSIMRFMAPAQNVKDIRVSPEDIQSFVAQYPNSRYSQYLRFSLVTYSHRSEFMTNMPALVDGYHSYLMTNAPWMVDFFP